MLLNYKNFTIVLYNGANVCPVRSKAVSFIKILFNSLIQVHWGRQVRHILIKAYHISMIFTHFQVIFQQTNVYLFVIFNDWKHAEHVHPQKCRGWITSFNYSETRHQKRTRHSLKSYVFRFVFEILAFLAGKGRHEFGAKF